MKSATATSKMKGAQSWSESTQKPFPQKDMSTWPWHCC